MWLLNWCKIDEYLDVKNCFWEKRSFGKLVLECEDEILNLTETSLEDKNLSCEKNNCLIHTISLVIICFLLLVVASIGCCYDETWIGVKKNTLYPINIK